MYNGSVTGWQLNWAVLLNEMPPELGTAGIQGRQEEVVAELIALVREYVEAERWS